MLRAKKLRTAFLFLPFVFCLYLSGVSVADDSCFQGLSTIPGNVKYYFEWDPTNPQEIGRNSNVEIKVIGGIPQYNWSVSGNGFNLSQSQSNGISNILTADSTACGSATITVTDGCGGTTTGYVRCTSGDWVLLGGCDGCAWGCPAIGIVTCLSHDDIIEGNYKWEFGAAHNYWHDPPDPDCPPFWQGWSCSGTCDFQTPSCGNPMQCVGEGSVSGGPNLTCYAGHFLLWEWMCEE
jgi:hypothetical protein